MYHVAECTRYKEAQEQSERKGRRKSAVAAAPHVAMQVWSRSPDAFTLECAHPLAPFQAFAIALASIHTDVLAQ